MKLFFKIFGIVVIAELVLGIAATIAQQTTDNIFVGTICSLIMQLLSLPLSLVSRTYPYYSTEPGWIIAVMMVSTYLIHAVIVYLVYKSVKKRSVK